MKSFGVIFVRMNPFKQILLTFVALSLFCLALEAAEGVQLSEMSLALVFIPWLVLAIVFVSLLQILMKIIRRESLRNDL